MSDRILLDPDRWLYGGEAICKYVGGITRRTLNRWMQKGGPLHGVIRQPTGRSLMAKKSEVDQALKKKARGAKR